MTSLTIYLLLCLYLVKNVFGKPNGLTLELFTQDSPNLDYHPSLNFSSNPQLLQQKNVVRPQLQRQDDYLFMVKIGIGTFQRRTQYEEYLLHIDTSSPLSWLQCEGCKKCFKQPKKPFPKNSSKSFHPILSSDKLCLTNQSDGKHCSYKIRYDNNSYTSGILAKETFYLCAPNESCTKFDKLVFGCGMDQNQIVYGKKSTENKIAGVLGLGWGPLSFVSQIESISDGKFSHCFPSSKVGRCENFKTFLRFGADAVSPKQKQMSTKLHQIVGSPFYYVELDGISLNKQRLNINASVFRVKNNQGGVIMNSGVMFTQLVRPAYDVLETELDSYFSKFKHIKGIHEQGAICYMRRSNKYLLRLPTITFHFKGLSSSANLVVTPDALFTVFSYQTVCLGIYPNDKMTVIGAHQQINHWFTFDTKSNQLSFHQENCCKNG